MTLWQLFWIFFYIGAFTIGGGLVAITLMQQELLGRGLISPERFFNMVAISESTPGPIGVNMATYIGYELFGVFGGIVTTLGTVLPSLICILIIAMYFGKFQEKPSVKAAFYGLRAGSTGMIAVAAWQVVQIALLSLDRYRETGSLAQIADWKALVLFAVLFAVNRFRDWHPLVLIAIGAAFGMLFM